MEGRSLGQRWWERGRRVEGSGQGQPAARTGKGRREREDSKEKDSFVTNAWRRGKRRSENGWNPGMHL